MNISFEAELISIESHTLIRLPLDASERLPSRGMVMVYGTLNDVEVQAPLEPDGKGSHWFEVSLSLKKRLNLEVGQSIILSIQPMSEWSEPDIPKDMMDQIINSGQLEQWQSITCKARWSWLRWIRSTKNPTTRQKRIDIACSKLSKGDKRPCCFDQTKCSVTDVSKSGVLLT